MNTKLRFENKELKRNVNLTEEAGREYGELWVGSCLLFVVVVVVVLE